MDKDLFSNDIKEINKLLVEDNKIDIVLISNFTNDIKDNLISDLSIKFNDSKLIDVTDKTFKTELVEIAKNVNTYYFDSLKKLNDSLNELIGFVVLNPLIDINVLCTIDKSFRQRQQQIKEYNKLESLISNSYQLLLYNISVAYKLKYDVENYEYLKKYVERSRKIFSNTINTFIRNKINKNYNHFKDRYTIFIKDMIAKNKEAKTKNTLMVKEYAFSILNLSSSLTIDFYTKESYSLLEKQLNKAHNEILKKLKLKEKDTLFDAYDDLKEYILKFNNGLYGHVLNAVSNMNKVVFLSKNETTSEIKKYSVLLNKVSTLDYNFDKQYEKYKKAILRHIIINKDKAYETISSIINSYKDIVKEIIENNLISTFNDSLLSLNNINYKCITIIDKLDSCLEVVDKKTIEKLFKENDNH